MCTFGVLGLSCASPGGPVWPKSKLAEVELAELEKKSWPKSKLAKSIALRSVGARTRGPQNFALFFDLFRSHFRSFSLSGGLLVEFWWCLKRRDPQMCTFGVLGLSCEAPAARSDGGFRIPARKKEKMKKKKKRSEKMEKNEKK